VPFADFWAIPGMDIPIEREASDLTTGKEAPASRLDVMIVVGVSIAVGIVMIGRIFFTGA